MLNKFKRNTNERERKKNNNRKTPLTHIIQSIALRKHKMRREKSESFESQLERWIKRAKPIEEWLLSFQKHARKKNVHRKTKMAILSAPFLQLFFFLALAPIILLLLWLSLLLLLFGFLKDGAQSSFFLIRFCFCVFCVSVCVCVVQCLCCMYYVCLFVAAFFHRLAFVKFPTLRISLSRSFFRCTHVCAVNKKRNRLTNS